MKDYWLLTFGNHKKLEKERKVEISKEKKIVNDRKVIPDPIDDRKFQE